MNKRRTAPTTPAALLHSPVARYDRKTYKWSYDGVDSERIRRAFLLLFEGDSYEAMAQKIGGGWTDNGLRRAMQNTIWYGVRTYPPCGDRKIPLERRVIPESQALVTYETWTKAQDIVAGRSKAWGSRLRQPRFLVAGMLDCDCDKPYYTKANSLKDRTRQQEHYARRLIRRSRMWSRKRSATRLYSCG